MLSHLREKLPSRWTPHLLGVLLAAPATAIAAPFCVQNQSIPPQCIYYDAQSCNFEAGKINGFCTVNPQQVTVRSGIGHYCLITSGMVSQCIYPDLSNCQAEAKRQQGACVQDPGRPESPGADPFKFVRPGLGG
jgi:hypothetical protein